MATLGAPPRFAGLLDLSPSVTLEAEPEAGPWDVVVAFAPHLDVLETRFAHGRALMAVDGGLWIAWPKQSSPLATAMRESDVRSLGLSAGLVDNKICAVDEDWSGLRFVVRLEDRPGRA